MRAPSGTTCPNRGQYLNKCVYVCISAFEHVCIHPQVFSPIPQTGGVIVVRFGEAIRVDDLILAHESTHGPLHKVCVYARAHVSVCMRVGSRKLEHNPKPVPKPVVRGASARVPLKRACARERRGGRRRKGGRRSVVLVLKYRRYCVQIMVRVGAP